MRLHVASGFQRIKHALKDIGVSMMKIQVNPAPGSLLGFFRQSADEALVNFPERHGQNFLSAKA
jgi:hypothetical protein